MNVLRGTLAISQMPEFPELFAEIDAAIEELGGCVAPKLNWSAPHDAAWVSSSKSLACKNADEVNTSANSFTSPHLSRDTHSVGTHHE